MMFMLNAAKNRTFGRDSILVSRPFIARHTLLFCVAWQLDFPIIFAVAQLYWP